MVFININNCNVIILAGGYSERMQFPKPYLQFDEQKTFLEKIINEYYEFGCERIFLVLNYEYNHPVFINYLKDKYNINCVINSRPDKGRFYSIKLGAELIKTDGYCFIQNVDNPFTDKFLLSKLYDTKDKYSYSVPVYKDKGGHPVLIGSSIINRINSENNTDVNLKEILREFKKICVQTDDIRITANINTDHDYKKYFEREPVLMIKNYEKHI